MNGDERPFAMAFSHMTGVGPLAFDKLLRHFPSIQAAYKAESHLLRAVVGGNQADIIVSFRRTFNVYKKYEELTEKGIGVLMRSDASFPPQLHNIPDTPICLYVRGDIGRIDFKHDFLFGVVGTRQQSAYGYDVTTQITGALARAGMVIVSGMAVGIDTTAHTACLDEGGRTVVVLGCGVDIVYPAVNRPLYNRVIDSGGIVISEFPPGMLSQKGLFISRNRLISGLARGVLVVEGAETSGALTTGRMAGEQNKDVFAVPGLITSDLARAPHILIKTGAKLVSSVNDILEEYSIQPVSQSSLSILPTLPENERSVYRRLLREPKRIDDLAADTGLPVSTVLNIISLLEIKGLIGKNVNASYSALSPSS